MSEADLRTRTKQFALRIVRLFGRLPNTSEAQVIGKQLLRSGTSVAANYRAAQRAKSRADFLSKLGTAEEEADESLFWLECLDDLATREHSELKRLMIEADELVAILVASRKRDRE